MHLFTSIMHLSFQIPIHSAVHQTLEAFAALELQLQLFVCLLHSIIQLLSLFCIQWALMTFNIILVFECKESPREKISHGLFSHSFVVLVNGCPEHQSVLFNKSFQRRDYSVWLLLFNFPWLSHMLRSYLRITSASPNMFDYNYTELSK